MNLKIYKQKAEWNQSQFGADKLLCFVEFPNCISSTTRRPFKWLPTYAQLEEIKEVLNDVEKQWKEKK